MKKLTFIPILVFCCVLKVSSQQDPLYTQFMTNPFLINPAISGTYPYYQIITNSRLQWAGLADAPVTNVISMYGPTVSQPMGFGGYIMHDSWGRTSQTTFSASYAYNYAIAEDLKISMGLALGLFQFKIEGGGTTYDDDDPVYQGQPLVTWGPDATVGVYLYSSIYHAGISVTNLLGNKLNVESDTAKGISRLTQHFYIHGGYKYLVTRELSVEPTLIVRRGGPGSLQLDINARVWYGKRQWDQNKIWGGLSFRSNDAFVIMVGFSYQRKLEIGYSYDIGINKLRTTHTGSHELMLGFKFNDIKDY